MLMRQVKRSDHLLSLTETRDQTVLLGPHTYTSCCQHSHNVQFHSKTPILGWRGLCKYQLGRVLQELFTPTCYLPKWYINHIFLFRAGTLRTESAPSSGWSTMNRKLTLSTVKEDRCVSVPFFFWMGSIQAACKLQRWALVKAHPTLKFRLNPRPC